MRTRLKRAAVLVVVVFAAAQLVRPSRANPPLDFRQTIAAHVEASSGVAAVLERACRDCHSNASVWPSSAQVAPLSWLMAYAVTKGRHAVNFSEWAGYSPDQRQVLLSVSCDDAASGKMPGAYTLFKPETRLSA